MSLKHLLSRRFSRPNTFNLGNTDIQLKHPPILTCIYLDRVPIQNKRVPKRVHKSDWFLALRLYP